MEEDLKPDTQNEKKIGPSRIKKMLSFFFKKGIAIIIIFLFLAVLWKITNGIYTRVVSTSVDQKGTLDYYPKVEKKESLATVAIDTIQLDLRPENAKDNGVNVTLHLALAYEGENGLLNEEITQRTEQIKDILRDIITRKVYRDFKGSKRIAELKKEIKDSINSILVNGKIVDIYFDQFKIVPH
jgi:flagellar basal body-associated protein FliL